MRWVTREDAKVDRIACPWLIKRFVDREADFLFVPADKVMDVAKAEGPYRTMSQGWSGHVDGSFLS